MTSPIERATSPLVSPELLLQEVQEAILSDERRMAALRLVHELDLPEGAIAGELVRSALFDCLHLHAEWSQLRAIDVVYFDPERPEPAIDRNLELELMAQASRRPWNVRNLAAARPNARSLADALSVYPDTASAIAVRLGPRNTVDVVAPYGLEDALGGVLRPTSPDMEAAMRKQVIEEKWRTRHPQLKFAD